VAIQLLALLGAAVTQRAALGGRGDRSLASAPVSPRMCTGLAASTALLTASAAVTMSSIERCARGPSAADVAPQALNPPNRARPLNNNGDDGGGGGGSDDGDGDDSGGSGGGGDDDGGTGQV